MQRLKLIALFAITALFAAACGGSGDDPGTTDGNGGEASGACEVGQVDGDLRFYNWSDYMDPDILTAFTAEYGVDVIEGFFDSNEAMLAQLQAGAEWDLVVPSDYMVGIMAEEGTALELQHDAIPNLANLDPDFTQVAYDVGNRFSAPYQYGTTGLGVNLATVTEALGENFPRSWSLLFDPEVAGQLPRGVTVLNDPREAIGAALKWLGHSLNETDETILREAADAIRNARGHIVTFDSEQYSENLVNGEADVVHGYDGNMIRAILDAGQDQYEYFVPEEGGTLWVDNLVIPSSSAAICTAHTFINFVLEAEIGAQLSEWTLYATPNAAALEVMDSELAQLLTGSEGVELEVIEDTGDAEILFTDLFAEARS